MDISQESENGEEDNLQVTTIELGLYFIEHVDLIFLSYIQLHTFFTWTSCLIIMNFGMMILNVSH